MANARNRSRRRGRRAPFRDPKPLILVVSEGEVTEPEYLNGVKNACRNPRVAVKVAEEHGTPMTLVRTAKQYKQGADKQAAREKDVNLAYDSVWCIFDIDEHPQAGEAMEMARDNRIELAVSNPCFELWLLLHFADSPGMQHRATIGKKLKQHVPGYDKHVDFETYRNGYSEAVARARRMDAQADDANEPYRNPTTGVYRLAELIRGTQ